MSKNLTVLIAALCLFVPAAGPAAAADTVPPLAKVEAFTGEASVGAADSWTPAEVGQALVETQALKTGAKSTLSVRFTEGEMLATVGENTLISLNDLLLKARLEKMRGRINQPEAGAPQTQMQVTPLTGVRGTDEAESKSEELKRQHHWEENGEPK